jgi:PKHD-type hydroxylase
MGRHTVFRYWESALPEKLCDLILSLGAGKETGKAALLPDGGAEYVDESIRKTDLQFWDPTHWVSGLIMHYAQWGNTEIWNYNLSHSQGVQFGRYGPGGTYDWHKDEFDQPFGEEAPPAWRGLSRKLSAVVNLSDPADYEGGELLFKDTYGKEVEDDTVLAAMRQRGSVVVFPAYTPHTVTPVTRGVRYSLVSWILGPPFA